MQSDPAPKPMAVTVYRLTACPHCNAANGVTAIRCWSCDQPLADQRWTGEVSDDELAPARDPALSDADFTFLDGDLLKRQKQAAVEDAVATANTFASTRSLGHSPAPALPHRPRVVERVDDERQGQPHSRLQLQSQPQAQPQQQRPQAPRLGAVPASESRQEEVARMWPAADPPQPMLMRPVPAPPLDSSAASSADVAGRLPWPSADPPPFDRPLDYDAPLPFTDPPPSLTGPSSERDTGSFDDSGTRFSVRGSAIGDAPGAAFKKRRPVEAIVLTLVLGAGLYAYFQPSPSADEAARGTAPVARSPKIDPEIQRLLDLSAPSTGSTTEATAPVPAPAPVQVQVPPATARVQAPARAPAPAPTPAPAPSRTPAPSPAPVAAPTAQPPAAPTVEVPIAPTSTTSAPQASSLAATPNAVTSPACAANSAALGLC